MNLRNSVLHTLTIFSSVGTLVCCALPALLVSIGAGAVMASLVSAVPQLVWISERKIPLFVFAGVLLCLIRACDLPESPNALPDRPRPCKILSTVRRVSFGVFIISLTIYATGFYFAFLVLRWELSEAD